MKEETNLYRSAKKTKNLFIYTGLVCLILAGVLLYSVGIFDGIFKVKPAIASGAVLLIMLFLFIKSIAGVRDKSELIHFDATGFLGKTTPISKTFGRVEWADVTNIRLDKMEGDTLVNVTVGNTEKYAGRLSSFKWKMVYDEQNFELNLMYSASEIDVNAEELYNLFLTYWKN